MTAWLVIHGEVRAVDACSALTLWEPTRPGEEPACERGIWIDTRTAYDSFERKSLVLGLRALERWGGKDTNAVGPAITVDCSLATGHCARDSKAAERLFNTHPWLEAALREQLGILRERARRAAAQTDRETGPQKALSQSSHRHMIAFHELFPADWDLVVTHRDQSYWCVDHHCTIQACACTEVLLTVERLHASGPPTSIGRARLDLGRHELCTVVRSMTITPELLDAFWAKYAGILRARREEARGAIRRHSRAPAPLSEPPAKPRSSAPRGTSHDKVGARCPRKKGTRRSLGSQHRQA
jgi:hypothetical protein